MTTVILLWFNGVLVLLALGLEVVRTWAPDRFLVGIETIVLLLMGLMLLLDLVYLAALVVLRCGGHT